MRQRIATAVTIAAVIIFVLIPALAASATDHKVTICHATGSDANPYLSLIHI